MTADVPNNTLMDHLPALIGVPSEAVRYSAGIVSGSGAGVEQAAKALLVQG